jgi:hypothetical protein
MSGGRGVSLSVVPYTANRIYQPHMRCHTRPTTGRLQRADTAKTLLPRAYAGWVVHTARRYPLDEYSPEQRLYRVLTRLRRSTINTGLALHLPEHHPNDQQTHYRHIT